MAVKKYLCIATRKSPLAYWQANNVKTRLKTYYPFMEIDLLPLITKGDHYLDSPLQKMGGKGLFVKELENALLANEADIAVHSMKDIPMTLAKGLTLAAISEREDARDVLISQSRKKISQLLSGSRIGSSSLRRQAQLKRLRPDLNVLTLRGNIDTRLKKLDAGEYEAIILAAAALIRLEKTTLISEYLTTNCFLPAPGQGALGIECREKDSELISLLSVLNHLPSYHCVMAERALSRKLGGGCQAPIAAYATCLPGEQLYLQGMVASLDGSVCIKSENYGAIREANKLGIKTAKELLAEGADNILKDFL